jgi:DNA-binding CsgD family transcriptional regulator
VLIPNIDFAIFRPKQADLSFGTQQARIGPDMRIFPVEPWARRAIVFTVVVSYLLLHLYEEFTQLESANRLALIQLHHWFQIGIVVVVFWSLWCEISGSERLRQRLAAEQVRRRRFSKDLAGHIAASFSAWGLTQAETEVAWLLLKGFQFSEVAEMRNVKEKTVRHQATQIYAKAGVKGRSELSASFLEDMLSDSDK